MGDEINKIPTFISQFLDKDLRIQMIGLLKEFRDCFAWDYHEMPGLDRKLIEHRLPIKPGFKPHKQRTSETDDF